MSRRRVEVPVVSTDIYYAYTDLDIPDGLTPQQELDFVHEAYRKDGAGWESEYTRDLSRALLIDSGITDLNYQTEIKEPI